MTFIARPVTGLATPMPVRMPSDEVIAIARERWNTYRFTEIADAIDAEWLRAQAALLWPALRPIAEVVVRRPQVVGGVTLAHGMRLKRVDPGRRRAPESVQPMLEAYERLRLHEWGAELSRQVEPILAAVLGQSLTYDRIYFLLYENDDYISTHNDAQTGPRVNVQFPIAIGGVAGLRVLDWDWHTYRDTAGLLRILGPDVWHEVLPLTGAPDAYRLNISLRYWPSDSGAHEMRADRNC